MALARNILRISFAVALLSSGGLIGCNGDDSSDPADSLSSTGGTSSQAGGGQASSTGGSSSASAATTASSSGGSPSTSTSTAITAGALTVSKETFDATMTEGCPAWPTSRLHPAVGVFFFSGTNPGPCTESYAVPSSGTSVTAYTYDADGRLDSAVYTNYDGTVTTDYTYEYSGVNLASTSTDGGVTSTYYYADGVTACLAQSYVAMWQVDTLGYPRRLTVDFLSSGASNATYLYEYEDCRLVARNVESGDTGGLASAWTYSYDAEGRMVTMELGDGSVFTYDYSCWN